MEEATAAEISQLAFEGLEVGAMRLGLKSTADLPCPRPLAIGDDIQGFIEGTVTGVRHYRTKDGILVRAHEVQVVRFLSEA